MSLVTHTRPAAPRCGEMRHLRPEAVLRLGCVRGSQGESRLQNIDGCERPRCYDERRPSLLSARYAAASPPRLPRLPRFSIPCLYLSTVRFAPSQRMLLLLVASSQHDRGEACLQPRQHLTDQMICSSFALRRCFLSFLFF